MSYTIDDTLLKSKVNLVNHLPDIGIDKIKEEIISGLKARPKYISSKFFYDKRGSELFEQIAKLDEYYPTRTEKRIISSIVNKLDIDFTEYDIVELGSGDSSKISLFLQQIPESKLTTINYYPVDISQSAIVNSMDFLSNEFPMVCTNGIIADFMHQIDVVPENSKRLFCFFGSTIGNLGRIEVREFMKLLGNQMQEGDSLLLGMDMIKDSFILEKAYNDSKQVTAEFNKNILSVINSLIDSDFNISDFEHTAFYNQKEKRIEMHLKALKDINVRLGENGDKIALIQGETIHTENSHKFDNDSIDLIAEWGDLDLINIFTDSNKWFCIAYYTKNSK